MRLPEDGTLDARAFGTADVSSEHCENGRSPCQPVFPRKEALKEGWRGWSARASEDLADRGDQAVPLPSQVTAWVQNTADGGFAREPSLPQEPGAHKDTEVAIISSRRSPRLLAGES